ncbi:hypothetical protein AAY473_008101, partial [Plecturocebus cupreus]
MEKKFCNLPTLQRANIQNLQRTKTDLQEKNNPIQKRQDNSKQGWCFQVTALWEAEAGGSRDQEFEISLVNM